MLVFEKLQELVEKGELTQEDVDKFLLALGLATGILQIAERNGKKYLRLARIIDFRSVPGFDVEVSRKQMLNDAVFSLARIIAIRRGRKRGFAKEDLELAKQLLGIGKEEKKEILTEYQRKEVIRRLRLLAPYLFE